MVSSSSDGLPTSNTIHIKDMGGATTRQREHICVCFLAFSAPTVIPSNTNGAISKQSDLPNPTGERKNTSLPLKYASMIEGLMRGRLGASPPPPLPRCFLTRRRPIFARFQNGAGDRKLLVFWGFPAIKTQTNRLQAG